jgi:hypothetical protein
LVKGPTVTLCTRCEAADKKAEAPATQDKAGRR